jgi:hypothetical protein
VYVSISTSNEGFEAMDEISLFPNPARETVAIRLPSTNKPERVSLFSLQGKNLPLEVSFDENGLMKFEIGHLPSGIYKVKLDFKQKSIIQTLIKE